MCHYYHGESRGPRCGHAALELHKSFPCLARACSLHHHHQVALKHAQFLLCSHGGCNKTKSLMFLLNRHSSRIFPSSTSGCPRPESRKRLQAMQNTPAPGEERQPETCSTCTTYWPPEQQRPPVPLPGRATWTSISSSSKS